MQCPACKTLVPVGPKFCPECGAKMPGISSQSEVRDEVNLRPMEHSQQTIAGPSPTESPSVATTAGQALSQRYELMEEVGRGGFAVVYKARDRKLDRLVAVKRLLRERAVKGEDDQAVQRFLREATMIASLSHRNIVQVYDHDQDEEGYYIVMELITGGTLRQRLKDLGKMKVPEAVEMMRGICQGMGHAHRKNLVHRDIKPANILLAVEAGETVVPKLVDFGLARGAEESGVSLSGYGMGTPAYMAPEQRRNAKGVNHTADIYALGKTLYEMVTGESPENVDPEAIPGVEGLGRIILKCIKTRPEDRYFSVDELRQELEALLTAPARAEGSRTTPSANACPNCQAVNPVDARFCDACGTGLTRVCPECEKENTVHQKHCRGCGTEMQGYLDLQKALGEMEKYRGEKRWSRVVKEGKEVAREMRLPGKKGQQIRQKIEECRREAEEKLATREQLTGSMEAAWKGEDYDGARESAEQLNELDPHDEGLRRRLGEIQERIEERDYAPAKAASEEAEESGEFGEAWKVWEMFLLKARPQKGGKEVRDRVARLKQLEKQSGELDGALAAGEFEMAAGHLGGMREMKCGDRLGERLKRKIEEKARSYAELVTRIEGLRREEKLEEAKARTESGMKEFPRSRVLGELAEECKEGLGFVNAEVEAGDLLEQGQVEKAIDVWEKLLREMRSVKYKVRAQDEVSRLKRVAEAERQRAAETEKQRVVEAEKQRAAGAAAAYLDSGNSLGMRFARVAGTDVLFSVWETRVRDYEVFVKEKGLKWEKPGFKQGPEHPAVMVSWDDGKAFCLWLTEKERREGRLGLKEEYRLPTDLEWSAAVSLLEESGGTPKAPANGGTLKAPANWLSRWAAFAGLSKEGAVTPVERSFADLSKEEGGTPQERDGKIPNVYPWGSQWPPPKGAGNYGSSLKVDDFDKTSPVGSFAGNQYGLYDLGGNVWEWCEDFYDGRSGARVLRGGSWHVDLADYLLSSYRYDRAPVNRSGGIGFRVVLVGLCST